MATGWIDALLGYTLLKAGLKAGTGITVTDLGSTLQQVEVAVTANPSTGITENYHKTLTGELTTLNDTDTDIVTWTMPDDTQAVVVVTCVGADASGNTGSRGYYLRKWIVEQEDGSINNIVGPVDVVPAVEDDSDWDVTLDADEAGYEKDVLRVKVKGHATNATTFSVRVVIDLAPSASV